MVRLFFRTEIHSGAAIIDITNIRSTAKFEKLAQRLLHMLVEAFENRAQRISIGIAIA